MPMSNLKLKTVINKCKNTSPLWIFHWFILMSLCKAFRDMLSCKKPIFTFTFETIFTGRNEVVAKVIFLHVCVILSTGGGSASVHAGIPPPWSRPNPQSRHLPEQTPRREQTPPWSRPPPPPPRKQTPAYGQRAAGTHPTGMHSCNIYFLTLSRWFKEFVFL